MAKELFLIRHSVAKEAYRGQADVDRELTDTGSLRAMQLGNYLKRKSIKADAILSSNAVRAKSTAELIAENILEHQENLLFEEDIYESSVRIMLNIINNLSPRWNKVVIVAHNPVLPYLAEYVTGGEVANLEPGGVFHLTTELDSWDAISAGTMRLQGYIDPQSFSQV